MMTHEYGLDPVDRWNCGTYAGRMTHSRQGERSCEPCLAAAAAYQRQRRAGKRPYRDMPKRRCARGLGWPL